MATITIIITVFNTIVKFFNSKLGLVLVIAVLIGVILMGNGLYALRKKEGIGEINALNYKLDITNRTLVQYKSKDSLTVIELNMYHLLKDDYLNLIVDNDSLQQHYYDHLQGMTDKITGLEATIIELGISGGGEGLIIYDTIHDTVRFNKHIHYSNAWDTINVAFNDSAYNLTYDIHNRLYVASKAIKKIKRDWTWIGVNWNFLGFKHKELKVRIKSENPNSVIDKAFSFKIVKTKDIK